MSGRPSKLRAATPKDDAFLVRLYASTRQEEMAATTWTAKQKDIFLRSQFGLRQRSYAQRYPRAETLVIVLHGVSIGSLIVDRSPDAITLVNIALLPEYRGAGIGRRLLEDLLAEAMRAAKPARLSVLTFNRARRLYERLGFGPVAIKGEYVCMEWNPQTDR